MKATLRQAQGERFIMRILVITVAITLLIPSNLFAAVPMDKIKQQIHLKKGASLSAGTAKVDITPNVGTPLAGYSKRRGKPSTGVRDPLYVRVLALNDGEDLAVFVSADILIFPPTMVDEILTRVTQKLKIPRQSIVLAATHTHSGPGAIAPGFLYGLVFGPYDPKVTEGIVARMTWAIQQAIEHQKPVRWAVGKDLLGALTENRMTPGGIFDPDLTVLALQASDGSLLAVVVNASAHPTLMDSKDMRFSADFPGEVTTRVETAYPGSICLFTNGAAGDLRPRDEIGDNPNQRIQRVGGVIVEQVQGTLSRMNFKEKGDLAVWGWWFPLPPPRLRLGRLSIPSSIGAFLRPTNGYLNLVAINDVVFVPLSAEVVTELGKSLKEKLMQQGIRPVLLGYANGYQGYAVTKEQYTNGSYESWMTWYGPNYGNTLIQQVEELAKLYEKKSDD